MACMARMNSRMRAAGWDQGIENRRSMWARTWDPRPSRNRPDDRACRSQAVVARAMGLRAKATAMDVPSSMGAAAVAARASGRKGSWLSSADQRPS